ncbi:MAG: SdrD B-like domain-containing protein [Verrucomicrobiota bacterium]
MSFAGAILQPAFTLAAAPRFESFTRASAGGGVSSLQVDVPAGTGEGDFLLAVFSVHDGVSFVIPSGWTLLDQGRSPSDASTLAVFYKVASVSELSPVTFSWNSSEQVVATMLRYSGVDGASPVNSSDVNSGTGITADAPSITTTVEDTTLIRILGAADDDLSSSPFPDGHFGRFFHESNPASAFSTGCAIAESIQRTAGATGVATFNFESPEEWRSMTIALAPKSSSAPGEIEGLVFRDNNGNGVPEAGEAGVEGLTVTAWGAGNTMVTTATTLPDGRYTLTGLTNSSIFRIELTGLPAHLLPGPAGNTGTTFRAVPAVGVDFAVLNPAEFTGSSTSPTLITSQFVEGVQSTTTDALISFPYDAGAANARQPDVDTPLPSNEAASSEIGSTFGLAWQRSSASLFAAAYLKRHAGFGPTNSTGTIYRIDRSGGSNSISTFVDINTLFGTNVAGDNPHPTGVTDFDIDPTSWDEVGKVGFGDLEISEDERTLWAINLADKQLYEIPLGTDPANPGPPATSGDVNRWPVDATPATSLEDLAGLPVTNAGDNRPFGLAVRDGLVYVGIVHTAQTSGLSADLAAFVYSFDPGTQAFTKVLEFDLDYPRGNAIRQTALTLAAAEWNPWTDDFNDGIGPIFEVADFFTPSFEGEYAYPQPMLSDIEFDNGDMIIGLRDRWGDQVGFKKPWPDGSGLGGFFDHRPIGDTAGDILRASPNGSGWALEGNTQSTPPGVFGPTTGTANGEGPEDGGASSGEFYYMDSYPVTSSNPTNDEVSMGGLVQVPGTDDVVSTVYNPVDDGASFYEGGIMWMGNGTGVRSRAYLAYSTTAAGTDLFFGQSNGLGDIEALLPPAPIELGNRVWNDLNVNGIQDPGETGINGVIVELVDVDGGSTVVGNASTTVNGNFYFGGINDLNMTSGSVLTGRSYRLRILLSDPSLAGLGVADPNLGGNDRSDSDGTVDGGYSVINVTTGDAGANNHTLDFGFKSLVGPGSISGTVTEDIDNDDAGDRSLAGMVITLLDSGGAVIDGDPGAAGIQPITATTAVDGSYVISAVPPGDYRVQRSDAGGYQGVASSDGGDVDVVGDISVVSVLSGTQTSGVDFVAERRPFGRLYDSSTGEILSGGSVSLLQTSGTPTTFTIGRNGSDGRVAFVVDGPGTFEVQITPPPGYALDNSRPVAGASLDPSGMPDPVVLGAAESGINPGFLTNPTAGSNPFYLVFELEPLSDPVVISNNFPLRRPHATSFPQFVFDNGLTGPDANPLPDFSGVGGNPDRDRKSNLEEFALAGDVETGLETCSFSVLENAGTGEIDLSFSRPVGVGDVNYTVESIGDLRNSPGGWTSHGFVATTVVDNLNGTETLTFADIEQHTGLTGGLGFVRLQLELDTNGDGSANVSTHTDARGWSRIAVESGHIESCSDPFPLEPLFSGRVDATVVGSMVLVDDSLAVGEDLGAALRATGDEYFLEVVGPAGSAFAGRRLDIDEAASTATQIVIDISGAFNTGAHVGLPADAEILVIPHETLDSVTPPQEFETSGFVLPFENGDLLHHYDNSTGMWNTFVLFGFGTRQWGDQSASNFVNVGPTTIVAPSKGFMIEPQNGAIDFVQTGLVRDWSFEHPVGAGWNIVGNPFPLRQSFEGRNMTVNPFTGSHAQSLSDQALFWRGDAVPGARGYGGYFLLSVVYNLATFEFWTSMANADFVDADASLVFEPSRAAFYFLQSPISTMEMPPDWTP